MEIPLGSCFIKIIQQHRKTIQYNKNEEDFTGIWQRCECVKWVKNFFQKWGIYKGREAKKRVGSDTISSQEVTPQNESLNLIEGDHEYIHGGDTVGIHFPMSLRLPYFLFYTNVQFHPIP